MSSKPIAIYYDMKATDTFEVTADRLYKMVRETAEKHPGVPRHLYLDIEGHRQLGAFDLDAWEVQHFVIDFLGTWLTGISTPLVKAEKLKQADDIPQQLSFMQGGDSADREYNIRLATQATGMPIYDSQTQMWVEPK